MVLQINTEVLPDGGRLLPWLSDRQYECLKFIFRYSVDKRDYPLGTEIAEHMVVSKQAVTTLINTLVKKGYLVRDRSVVQRNIRLTSAAVEKMNRDEGVGSTPDLFNSLPGGQL